MTIIASEDSRNLHWSKNSIGSKLLLKMGWTEGTGLGRDRQGTAVALRAVRKHDSDAGIGATHDGADVTGNQKWNQTTDTFANVLKTLKSQHSSMSVNDNDNDEDGGSDDGSTKQQKKKKKKKKLVLAQNKVNAGHSRKMREAKDLRNKSDADMAAIFGGVPNNNIRTTKTKKRSRSEPIVDSSPPNIVVAELDSKSEQEAKAEDSTADKEEVDATTGQKLKKEKKRSKRKESKSKSSSNDAEADNDQEKPKKKKRRKEAKEQVS